MMIRTSAILALLVILGCTTAGNAPATAQPQSEFKNLQVLPRTITRPELLTLMRSFNRALGVKCNHCHAPTNPPGEQPDFPSDAKEEKRVARVMIQMTGQINTAWMERVEVAEGHEPSSAATPAEPRVHCWTCHRGKTEPEMPPPPPPPANPG